MSVLTIGSCEILPRSEAAIKKNGAISTSQKILWLGGSAFIENPNAIKSGSYTSAEIEGELVSEAQQWKANDGRSGAMSVITFKPTKLLTAKGGK